MCIDVIERRCMMLVHLPVTARADKISSVKSVDKYDMIMHLNFQFEFGGGCASHSHRLEVHGPFNTIGPIIQFFVPKIQKNWFS